MTQTVFTAGSPITSRLKLGITPDGTTTVNVTARRPDGTAVSTTAPSAWGGTAGDEMSVQWFATDDGASGSATLSAVGDWLVVWTVTGTGAVVAPKVYNVAPLPGTGTRPAWSPFLSDVADHAPFLTVDTLTPGSQLWLGTFTGATSPTDEQAQRHVDAAVAAIAARTGAIPSTLYGLARATAALRAAASILRAFARNRDDRDAAATLDARADADLAQLVDGAETAGTVTPTGPAPVGIYPDPVAWGDCYL